MLRWVDEAATLGHIDTDRRAGVLALLTAELAEIRAGRPPASRAAAPGPDLTPSTVATPTASCHPPSSWPGTRRVVDLLLLPGSGGIGVEPQLPPLLDRLRAFAIDWVDHPARDYSRTAGRCATRSSTSHTANSRPGSHNTAPLASWTSSAALWRYFADCSAWPGRSAGPARPGGRDPHAIHRAAAGPAVRPARAGPARSRGRRGAGWPPAGPA